MKVYNDLLSKQSLQDTVRNIFEKVLFALTIWEFCISDDRIKLKLKKRITNIYFGEGRIQFDPPDKKIPDIRENPFTSFLLTSRTKYSRVN